MFGNNVYIYNTIYTDTLATHSCDWCGMSGATN